MNANAQFKKNVVGALVAGIFSPCMVHADQLNLAQFPPGKISVVPAANVILMVDNRPDMDLPFSGVPGTKTRLQHVKDAATTVFSDPLLIPEGKMRIIWAPTNSISATGNVSNNISAAAGLMVPWTNTRRAELINFVTNLKTSNGWDMSATISSMLLYLQNNNLDVNNPWAASPGIKASPFLGCRRAYGVVLTDGNWLKTKWDFDNKNYDVNGKLVPTNGSDGIPRTLPDGTVFDINSPQTKMYQDTSRATVSDAAFYAWSKDLQPGIPNEIVPSTTDGIPAVENIGGVDIDRYWNPKHNPASWQHMVTYTLGFSSTKNPWVAAGIPVAPFWDTVNDDMYAGDFPKLVNGTVAWPKIAVNDLTFSETQDQETARPVELWHAAINGRGRYYPLGPGSKYSVEDAFRDVITRINRDNFPSATGSAGGASSNIRSGFNVYGAGYVPERWSGYVNSKKIDTAGNMSPNADWGSTAGIPNTTASLLDARNISTRVVLTTNDQVPNTGVSFEWDAGTTKLSAAQKALFNVDGKGQDRINFLRGERTKEDGTAFRIRDSRQGDIVNSSIWYVDAPASNYSFAGYKAFSSAQRQRLPMIYVGGNDGMLHGFSAVNGEEQIAYVPKGVMADLPPLSAPSYTHRYFVDGSPFTGDLKVGAGNAAADWRTYLVGTLAAGGKGYFLLDVTQPGNKSGAGSSTFTASNAASLVVLDRTLNASATVASGADEDIGHIFAPPVLDESNPFKATQIAKLNDDRWAVVMGNGYNSKNERPVLLIQYLDSTNEVNGVKELKRLVATGTQVPSSPVVPADANVVANGLSAPRLVDINSDGRMDVAYAGDLKGNLWKFDLTSKTAADWGVAVWGGTNTAPCTTSATGCTPLFTASHSGKPQGITAAPTVKANDRGAGGLMVAFGTGVNFNDDDGKSTDVQSVYSVLDNTKYKLVDGGKLVAVNTNLVDDPVVHPEGVGAIPAAVTLANLVEQSLSSPTAIAGQGKSSAREFWNVTQNTVTYTGPVAGQNKGWYFHFPESRERVLKPMGFFDGSNNLTVFSTAPAFTGTSSGEESCAPAGTNEKAYLTLMNIMDGKKPSVQVMDANGDGFYNTSDQGVSRMSVAQGAISSVTGKKKITFSGNDGKPDDLALMPEQAMRPSWRQLQ